MPSSVPNRLPRVGACGFRVAEVTLAELREVVFSMKLSGACEPDSVCIRVSQGWSTFFAFFHEAVFEYVNFTSQFEEPNA